MSFFTIDPTLDHVTLAGDGTGALAFSVANKSGVGRQLKAIVEPGAAAEQRSWYTVTPALQDARVDETVQFTVAIAVPPGTAVGTYPFRLKVVAEDDPDDVYSESQSVTVEVAEIGAEPKPFPWWILIAAAAAVIVVAVVGVLVFTGDGDVAVTMGAGDPPSIDEIVGDTDYIGTRELQRAEEADISLFADVSDDVDAPSELSVNWFRVNASTGAFIEALGTGRQLQTSLTSGCTGPFTHTLRVIVADREDNATLGTLEVTITPATPLSVDDCGFVRPVPGGGVLSAELLPGASPQLIEGINDKLRLGGG